MRKWTLGAKALSIRPPEIMTPLKMVTGLAPKFTTQALQMGPVQKKEECYPVRNSTVEITVKKKWSILYSCY